VAYIQPPATIIFISSDKGFLDIAEWLSACGFNVIFLAQQKAYAAIKYSRAAVLYSWPDLLLKVKSQSMHKRRPPFPTGMAFAESDFFHSAPRPIQASKAHAAIEPLVPSSHATFEVPSHFSVLVDVLVDLLQDGISRISFSQLGTLLMNRRSSIYREAGVSKLKQYAQLAQKAGIVNLREAEVELHARLYQ